MTRHFFSIAARAWALSAFVMFFAVWLSAPDARAYDFVAPHGGRILSETGGDDATTQLAEGFPGQRSEPGKDRWIEPVDGDGGFDNVAPRLEAEEGPGGLEWDPSPTYRTRYTFGTDYAGNEQGNNWFTKIPWAWYDDTYDKWYVVFSAAAIRTYDVDAGTSTVYWGRHLNSRSKIVLTTGKLELFDIAGKTYTFSESEGYKCTEIKGLGGTKVSITYASGSITVKQNDGSSDVRRFLYTLTDHGSGDRIDKIEVAEWTGSSWDTYRTIEFTYHEQVTGAEGSSTGDLIGIEDTKDLSESGKSYTRKWVLKYYTGTYNSSTNPGNPYQVSAVIGPGSVKAFEDANPSLDIYTRTVSELSGYLDRTYEYQSDKRLRDLVLEESCGCGGSEGAYSYTWDIKIFPGDMNTWYRRANITLPTGALLMVDYNVYGQTLNRIVQEDAENSSSRRWITTYRHDSSGRLTDSYSVAASSSYSDSTHVVTTASSTGMRYEYTYDSNSALSTAKLRKGSSGSAYYQRKTAFTFRGSGDRRRYFKTSEKRYPAETTSDTGSEETTHSYTYHTADALAVEKRTTTLPVVTTAQNGPNSAVPVYDYFEVDGLHTWSKDGEGHVHYRGFDEDLRVPVITVIDVDTDSADRPAGVPAPPETTFESSTGLNLVNEMEYDALGRITKRIGPAFDAYDGSSMTSTKKTARWHYSKLSGDELVVLQYPHLGSSYFHAAVTMTVLDHDGNTITECQGELDSATRDTDLSDDLDETQSTIASAFDGAIIQRTDSTYTGGKVTKVEVWSDADNSGAAKFTTTNTYDSSGRLETTKTPAGTITRLSYDVLGREKSRKVGTIDGGGSDNMTLVEELFYDDEEDTSTNVGDGFLTRRKLYTSYTTESEHPVRVTDTVYDHGGRATDIYEPGDVLIENDYDNLNRVAETRRYDDSGGSPVLMARSASFYDAWGQVYEARTYGITGGSGSGYTNVETWRDKRGLVTKTLSQGKVFQKTQYDGAGRVVSKAISYDTDETAYADVDDLSGDTVMEETRYVLDAGGGVELVGFYQRNHDGTGTGGLTVGSSGNGRAQYTAAWYDELHRTTHVVRYGTNAGTDMTARPSGNPPSSSSSTSLVEKYTYTIKSQKKDVTNPMGITSRIEYEDWGAVSAEFGNYVNGSPGPDADEDRWIHYTYNSAGQLQYRTAEDDTYVHTTQYFYGVTRGTDAGDSRIASNDLLHVARYATWPATIQDDFAYNAQGERIWKEDGSDSEHVYDYDERGRLIHDRATVLATGVDDAVRRTSTTYDALDRRVNVTTYDNPTVGSGSAVNDVQYEYDKFGVVKTLYQEWTGAVNTGSSPKVSYAWSFPTDGTTGLRRTSTTYPDSTVITDVYSSGTDDTLSRLSGRKNGTDWVFQESYLGMDRLVEREYGETGKTWSLVGTDSANNDNYLGLDRFGRIDYLKVGGGGTNSFLYDYFYDSRIKSRTNGGEDLDHQYSYDDLGRLTRHWRGDFPDYSLIECFTRDSFGSVTEYFNGTGYPCDSGSDIDHNSLNEIEEVDSDPFDNSQAGEMTKRGSNQPQRFDAGSRLVEVKIGSSYVISTFEYNGLGQKVKRVDSPMLDDTYYYYSAEGQLLEETKVSGGSKIYSYVWGAQNVDDIVQRIGTTTNSEEYCVLDANNNVTTRLDYNGWAFARYIYDGNGNPSQLDSDWDTWETIDEDLYLFTGRQYHMDGGQYDYRARWMDPELGVFTSRDPIGIWGDPLAFGNGYLYAGGDPVNRTDPWGLGELTIDHNPLELRRDAPGFPLRGRFLAGSLRCRYKATLSFTIVPTPEHQANPEEGVARMASAARAQDPERLLLAWAGLFQIVGRCTCSYVCPPCPSLDQSPCTSMDELHQGLDGRSLPAFWAASGRDCSPEGCAERFGAAPSYDCCLPGGLKSITSPVLPAIRLFQFGRMAVNFVVRIGEAGRRIILPPSPFQLPPAPLPK